MFSEQIKREIKTQLDGLKKDIKDEFEASIKRITKSTCKEIVAELFTEDSEEEFIIDSPFYFSDALRKTVSGEMKSNISKHVLNKFDETYKVKAAGFIAGEEFIDLVIERIKRKQLVN